MREDLKVPKSEIDVGWRSVLWKSGEIGPSDHFVSQQE